MYKVGDLVSMTSEKFLKLAKLGLILVMPRTGRTVTWVSTLNKYMIFDREGNPTIPLNLSKSIFLNALNEGEKFVVLHEPKGIKILKRKPI